MLTPIEIEKRKLSKAMFGYSEKDVNAFLSELTKDYEQLYRENIEIKDKLHTLEDGVKHYKTVEETLQQTLIVAQTSADDVRNAAAAKGELIIKEAEIKAEDVVKNANKELLEINNKCEELKTFYYVSKAKMESLLNAQLEILKQSEV